MNQKKSWWERIEFSAVLTVIGVVVLFSTAVGVTLLAPRFVDKAWTEPSSYYQVQMYEVADPHLYVSSTLTGGNVLQFVYHLKNRFSLLAFQESQTVRIVTFPDLERYITRYGDNQIKLTSRLLLLREPIKSKNFDAIVSAKELNNSLQQQANGLKIDYKILELYDPELEEAFTVAETDGVEERFIDEGYLFLDPSPDVPYHKDPGFVFVNNPKEYRISPIRKGWRYDPLGKAVADLDELTDQGFRSRKTLIELGEDIFAYEGCWYCHTDQTRTLVQDVVVNGSESYPAPPSSPNEYIYQRVTFPGTRRIGPDISRVAIKRSGRDWHRSHFWAPKTESPGSIMPAFRHFFDDDPSGTVKRTTGVPNYKFEAVFQYLMTKGSRITPPTQAWWLGKDPVKTLEIIEGRDE